MAHVSTDIIHDGWQGTRNFGKKVPEFDVRFVVKVDDKQDGPNFILKECRLPKPGDKYKDIGNDDFGFAICKSVSVSPIGDTTWRASAKYAAPVFGEDESDDSMIDEDDEPTDDVELQGVDVSISLVQMSRPALSGSYLGQWDATRGASLMQWPGGPVAGPASALGAGPFPDAITNSSRVPFDPPPEIDYSRTSISISRNQKKFNGNTLLKFNDTVNQDRIRLRFGAAGGRFKFDIKPFEAKMQSIGCQRRKSADGVVYWRVTFELHVDTIFGWRPEILDRGYSHTAAWTPVTSSYRSAGEVAASTAAPATVPAAVPITTPAGHTTSEPVLLNGAGIPLGHGKDPVFLKYQK